MAKETYVHGKRDLCTWQKRPMYMAKETYVDGKRGLCTWQKRPMCHHPQNDLRSLTRSAITAIQPLIRCLYASWERTEERDSCAPVGHSLALKHWAVNRQKKKKKWKVDSCALVPRAADQSSAVYFPLFLVYFSTFFSPL